MSNIRSFKMNPNGKFCKWHRFSFLLQDILAVADSTPLICSHLHFIWFLLLTHIDIARGANLASNSHMPSQFQKVLVLHLPENLVGTELLNFDEIPTLAGCCNWRWKIFAQEFWKIFALHSRCVNISARNLFSLELSIVMYQNGFTVHNFSQYAHIFVTMKIICTNQIQHCTVLK